MGKPITNPPKDPLERLPGWHKEVLDEHFKGLPGLYVRRLLDEASAAERSAQGKHSAVKRHEARNKIKELAHAHYLRHRGSYKSNKDAAGGLVAQFGEFKFRTYENWVSKWSSE
jgi:hypothetical protein